MAQASGIFNVIRQIGGSFGVAILGALLTRRIIFHTAMYAQSVDAYSPAYRNAMLGIAQFSQHMVGGPAAAATMRAQALIGMHIGREAFVQSVNDDFFLAAVITLVGAIPILFLRSHKQQAGQTMPAAD